MRGARQARGGGGGGGGGGLLKRKTKTPLDRLLLLRLFILDSQNPSERPQ